MSRGSGACPTRTPRRSGTSGLPTRSTTACTVGGRLAGRLAPGPGPHITRPGWAAAGSSGGEPRVLPSTAAPAPLPFPLPCRRQLLREAERGHLPLGRAHGQRAPHLRRSAAHLVGAASKEGPGRQSVARPAAPSPVAPDGRVHASACVCARRPPLRRPCLPACRQKLEKWHDRSQWGRHSKGTGNKLPLRVVKTIQEDGLPLVGVEVRRGAGGQRVQGSGAGQPAPALSSPCCASSRHAPPRHPAPGTRCPAFMPCPPSFSYTAGHQPRGAAVL